MVHTTKQDSRSGEKMFKEERRYNLQLKLDCNENTLQSFIILHSYFFLLEYSNLAEYSVASVLANSENRLLTSCACTVIAGQRLWCAGGNNNSFFYFFHLKYLSPSIKSVLGLSCAWFLHGMLTKLLRQSLATVTEQSVIVMLSQRKDSGFSLQRELFPDLTKQGRPPWIITITLVKCNSIGPVMLLSQMQERFVAMVTVLLRSWHLRVPTLMPLWLQPLRKNRYCRKYLQGLKE